jgi:hypothetical protein
MDKLSVTLQAKINSRPLRTYLRSNSHIIDRNYSILPTSISTKTEVPIPDNFDGRKVWDGLLTPVMNQGSCGSCWAFSSTSCLADRFNIQSLGQLNIQLSAAKLVLCDFGGDYSKKNPATDKGYFLKLNYDNLSNNACFGNSLYEAWRYLYVIGTNTEECIPYKLGKFSKASELPMCFSVSGLIGDMCSDVQYNSSTNEELGTPARFYRAFHIYAIPGTKKDNGSEYNIRSNIYYWGPVSTGMVVYSDFYTFDPTTEIYKWNGIGGPVGGHAVEIVGWGDDNNTKYWIIRNSWGEEWGEKGYFRMIRGINNCELEENIISGVPDYFYPKNYNHLSSAQWLEKPEAIHERLEVINNVDYSGGGIDNNSGYTRRAIMTKPWLNLEGPISLDNLPKWNKFIAGIDGSTYNRYKFQKVVRDSNNDIRYGKQSLWLTVAILSILVMLVIGVVILNMLNYISPSG